MIAAVMCGGAATRMKKARTEKPLLSVGGTPIITRVIQSLHEAQSFERVVAVVSPNAPTTRQFLESRGVETFETPGSGYSLDLSLVLKAMKPAKVFVISADMPLVGARVIGEILAAPQSRPLLSVVLTNAFVESLGIAPSVAFSRGGVDYCYAGISIFDTSHLSEEGGVKVVDEEYIVRDDIELAVNVNTKEEMELAEKLLIQRA